MSKNSKSKIKVKSKKSKRIPAIKNFVFIFDANSQYEKASFIISAIAINGFYAAEKIKSYILW